MRKFFFRFGVVIAVLIGAGAIGFVMITRSGFALDAESKAFIEDTVVTVASGWDADALWRRSTSRFRQTATEDDLRAFFSVADTALGRLLKYQGADGQAIVNYSPAGRTVTARYNARASFEKGDADIAIAAVKDGAGWRVEGFHINSTTLMRNLVGMRG
jgi:hypothetical protein